MADKHTRLTVQMLWIQIRASALWCGNCLSFLCPCGFYPGTLLSSHISKTWSVIWLKTVIAINVSENAGGFSICALRLLPTSWGLYRYSRPKVSWDRLQHTWDPARVTGSVWMDSLITWAVCSSPTCPFYGSRTAGAVSWCQWALQVCPPRGAMESQSDRSWYHQVHHHGNNGLVPGHWPQVSMLSGRSLSSAGAKP